MIRQHDLVIYWVQERYKAPAFRLVISIHVDLLKL